MAIDPNSVLRMSQFLESKKDSAKKDKLDKLSLVKELVDMDTSFKAHVQKQKILTQTATSLFNYTSLLTNELEAMNNGNASIPAKYELMKKIVDAKAGMSNHGQIPGILMVEALVTPEGQASSEQMRFVSKQLHLPSLEVFATQAEPGEDGLVRFKNKVMEGTPYNPESQGKPITERRSIAWAMTNVESNSDAANAVARSISNPTERKEYMKSHGWWWDDEESSLLSKKDSTARINNEKATLEGNTQAALIISKLREQLAVPYGDNPPALEAALKAAIIDGKIGNMAARYAEISSLNTNPDGTKVTDGLTLHKIDQINLMYAKAAEDADSGIAPEVARIAHGLAMQNLGILEWQDFEKKEKEIHNQKQNKATLGVLSNLDKPDVAKEVVIKHLLSTGTIATPEETIELVANHFRNKGDVNREFEVRWQGVIETELADVNNELSFGLNSVALGGELKDGILSPHYKVKFKLETIRESLKAGERPEGLAKWVNLESVENALEQVRSVEAQFSESRGKNLASPAHQRAALEYLRNHGRISDVNYESRIKAIKAIEEREYKESGKSTRWRDQRAVQSFLLGALGSASPDEKAAALAHSRKAILNQLPEGVTPEERGYGYMFPKKVSRYAQVSKDISALMALSYDHHMKSPEDQIQTDREAVELLENAFGIFSDPASPDDASIAAVTRADLEKRRASLMAELNAQSSVTGIPLVRLTAADYANINAASNEYTNYIQGRTYSVNGVPATREEALVYSPTVASSKNNENRLAFDRLKHDDNERLRWMAAALDSLKAEDTDGRWSLQDQIDRAADLWAQAKGQTGGDGGVSDEWLQAAINNPNTPYENRQKLQAELDRRNLLKK